MRVDGINHGDARHGVDRTVAGGLITEIATSKLGEYPTNQNGGIHAFFETHGFDGVTRATDARESVRAPGQTG